MTFAAGRSTDGYGHAQAGLCRVRHTDLTRTGRRGYREFCEDVRLDVWYGDDWKEGKEMKGIERKTYECFLA